MTEKEIVRSLRHCSTTDCVDCPACKYGTHLGCVERLVADAADLIERLTAERDALREKQRWIPVTERMPETGVPVLVNYIGTDELPHADGVVAWTDWGALWWEGSLVDSESEVTVPITHWMPLPEAPEGMEGNVNE